MTINFTVEKAVFEVNLDYICKDANKKVPKMDDSRQIDKTRLVVDYPESKIKELFKIINENCSFDTKVKILDYLKDNNVKWYKFLMKIMED